MTEPTPYTLTTLTDKQWDKQLASQEKLKIAELEATARIEIEKLRIQNGNLSRRHSLIQGVLGGGAFFIVVLALILSVAYGLYQSGVRNDEIGIECVQSGGRWTEGTGGDPSRCDRP